MAIRTARSWWPRLLLSGTAGALALAALLLRPGGDRPWQVVWAEDGSRFLMTGRVDPSPSHWLTVYAGYRHLIPHMIGSLAATVSLDDAPVVFALSGALVDLGCLALLAVGLRRWLSRWWMIPLVVLALTMLTVTVGDVVANAVNLHYFGRLGLIGLALGRPRSRVWAVLAAFAALLLGLTEPLVLLVLPVAVVDALLPRQEAGGWGRRLAVPGAMAVASAVQGITVLTFPRWAVPPTGPVPDPIELYRYQVLAEGLFPRPRYRDGGLPSIVAALLAAAALAVVLLATQRRSGAARLAVALGLAGYGAGFLVVDSRFNHAYSTRYSFLPAVLLVAGILVLAAGERVVQQALFVVIVAVTLVGGALNWTVLGGRGLGPQWRPGVLAARQSCLHHPGPGRIVSIPSAPAFFGPFRASCSWLVPAEPGRPVAGLSKPPRERAGARVDAGTPIRRTPIRRGDARRSLSPLGPVPASPAPPRGPWR